MREPEHLAAETIAGEITLRVQAWYGPDAVVITRVPVVRKLTNSYFLRYTVKTHTGKYPGILIKIPRPAGLNTLHESMQAQKPRVSIQHEYEFLSSCMRIFNDGYMNEFCAVRPLDFLPQWNAIVMEELNCHSLRIIQRNGNNLHDCITRAARWLKIFHNSMGKRTLMNVDATLLRSQFERLYAKLDSRIPVQQMRSIRTLVDRRLPEIENLPMRFAQLHGDFKCGNILVMNDGRIGAVDSKLRGIGPIYSDFGRFIASVLSQRWNVLTFARFLDYAHCKQDIVRGYFTDEPVLTIAMDIYAAYSILEKWEEHERSLERLGYIPFMKRTRREYFSQVLAQCLS